MMQRIEVDEVAQAAWTAEVRRFHTEARLEVVDLAGQRHTLVAVSPQGVSCQPFDGQASVYRLSASGRSTRWPCSNGLSERMHVRVDGRGQLEVWSGSLAIAKHFDSEASPAEWCPGLNHVEASKVRNLEALLDCDQAQALKSLDLGGAESLDDLGLAGRLTGLRSLYLNGCPELTDLAPLEHLTQLKSLDLSSCDRLTDLSPLRDLHQLRELDLHSCDALANLAPLAGMTQLGSLDLSGCKQVTDLAPLAGMSDLESLKLRGCDRIRDLQPLRHLVQLTTLDLSNCGALANLGPLGELKELKSLRLTQCGLLSDLSPLADLRQLTELDLSWCESIQDLGPLGRLAGLRSLNLSGCPQVSELEPLADLRQLTALDLSGCESIQDLGPLSRLVQLTSLKLNACNELIELAVLPTLTHLESIDVSYCESLSLIAPLAKLSALSEIDLTGCANVRDVTALYDAPALCRLSYDETAVRDSILLASALRRGDEDLPDRLQTASTSFRFSKAPAAEAQLLVDAAKTLATTPLDCPEVLAGVASAFRTRGEVPPKVWLVLLEEIVHTPDPTLRLAFEVALTDLPLADSERVLAAALLALADVPATAKAWALDLAQRSLLPVAASAIHAREVAPAAAVFFHAQGLAGEVDAWLERGSVAQVPAWRDRVLVALLGRALRCGEILEARRLLALLHTPERRDEARGLLVQHLSSRAEFRDGAAELDAIVDRAVRASVAANALRQAPAWAGEPDAGLSLLLALDGDPDTLAEVLTSMIQQAPDSELVRHLAAVFAPKQGVDLAESVDALFAHPSVADRVKPKQLAALRGRISADAALVHQALVHGTAALLEAEGLVDEDERAEIMAAILGQPA